MGTTLCGRVGCGEAAIAALLMSPQDTQAWLVALDHDFAPEGVALCANHADRISVPFGWTLQDDRPPVKKKRRRKKPEPEPEPELLPAEPVTAEPEPEPVAVEPEPEPEPVAVEPEPEPEPVAVEADPEPEVAKLEREPFTEDDPGYVPPEYQFREDGVTGPHDDPTLQLPAITIDPPSPSEVPLDSDRVAAAIDEDSPRLSVVPPDDDPDKTFDFSDEGQGAFWNEPPPAEPEPDENTPLLKRAFRVVRDD